MWSPAEFPIARLMTPPFTETVSGYTYRGLGLHRLNLRASKRPTWALTHLGSGHSLAHIKGAVSVAFPIATEFAECGDWSFDGLYGWKNVDPDILKRAADLLYKHAPKAWKPQSRNAHSEDAARAVMMAREA